MKRSFTYCYRLLAMISILYALWMLWAQPLAPWLGLLVISAAPTINWLIPFDQVFVAHHKVRLPKVSSLIAVGLALVLVTTPERGQVLWFSLANVGMFLLTVYWAEKR